jgi:hypothetical protein
MTVETAICLACALTSLAAAALSWWTVKINQRLMDGFIATGKRIAGVKAREMALTLQRNADEARELAAEEEAKRGIQIED